MSVDLGLIRVFRLVVFPLLIALFGAVNLFTCNLLTDDIAAVGVENAVGMVRSPCA